MSPIPLAGRSLLLVAYLFALSQFLMAWLLAWAYVRAAARFDRMARDVIEKGTR